MAILGKALTHLAPLFLQVRLFLVNVCLPLMAFCLPASYLLFNHTCLAGLTGSLESFLRMDHLFRLLPGLIEDGGHLSLRVSRLGKLPATPPWKSARHQAAVHQRPPLQASARGHSASSVFANVSNRR